MVLLLILLDKPYEEAFSGGKCYKSLKTNKLIFYNDGFSI
jgi:hypothetical protein